MNARTSWLGAAPQRTSRTTAPSAASDTASSATLGGSLTTTLALGIPGDSVMAVMIGSMIIWGITPGPTQNPGDPDSLPRNRQEAE